MSDKEEKMIAVFNKGQRTYHTTTGVLLPKTSIEVPESEAKSLLEYFDIVDLDKVAPKASSQMKDLKAENEKLKAELASKEAETPAPEDTDDEPAEPAHHKKATESGKGGKKGKK